MMEEQEQFQPSYVRVADKDPNFLQWFLNNKEGIDNLKFMWRGWERNEHGIWYKPEDSEDKRIMNEKGIHWSTQIMESYLDRVFQATNWDSENMNFAMRAGARVIWHGLVFQYRDFEISKINAKVVGHEMFTRIHAMLLSARGQGIRDFLSKTHQVSEIRQIQPETQSGFFSGVRSFLGGNRRQEPGM